MNLHDELDRLANAAPPVVDPERVLRLAQGVKSRRLVGIPALAVLAVLVAVVPLMSRPRHVEQAIGSPDSTPSADPGLQTMLLKVDKPINGAIDQQALERTREIVEARAKALGLNAVASIKDDNVVVQSSSKDQTTSATLSAPGKLQMRKVLKAVSNEQDEVATATSSTAKAPGEAATLPALITKLGTAYSYALTLRDPAEAKPPKVVRFSQLTGYEVALLPAEIQFNVPTVTCKQLNSRPVNVDYPADKQITACEGDNAKYLLDVAKVAGVDVADAKARKQPQSGSHSVVVKFTLTGGPKWTELSREATENSGKSCAAAAVGDLGHCRIAFMVDGRVLTSPQIVTVLPGVEVEIDGGFTQAAANVLAAQVGPGELPLKIVVDPPK